MNPTTVHSTTSTSQSADQNFATCGSNPISLLSHQNCGQEGKVGIFITLREKMSQAPPGSPACQDQAPQQLVERTIGLAKSPPDGALPFLHRLQRVNNFREPSGSGGALGYNRTLSGRTSWTNVALRFSLTVCLCSTVRRGPWTQRWSLHYGGMELHDLDVLTSMVRLLRLPVEGRSSVALSSQGDRGGRRNVSGDCAFSAPTGES